MGGWWRVPCGEPVPYLPRARLWCRVRRSSFLCFFLRMRLRRFLTKDPMTVRHYVVRVDGSQSEPARYDG